MKLSATLKNNRGGQKVTADDTRILIQLRHGNKVIGELGFYNIIDNKVEGYHITWKKPNTPLNLEKETIEHFEKAKQLTDTIIEPWDINHDDNKCGHPLCGKTICREDVPL